MNTTKVLLAALLLSFASGVWAVETNPETQDAEKRSGVKKATKEFLRTLKFSGYIIGKYSIDDKSGDGKTGDGFDLRLIRLNVQGDVYDGIGYRFQAEVNGAPGVDKGPRIVDAYIEWKKYDFVQLKLGQFKRPFGYENPISPLAVGIGDYSQITKKLVGIGGDRCGEHNSGGRDLGLQAQGDFLKAKKDDGHYWMHYQVGVFNGQGINHKDEDHHKDLIGGLWFRPVKKLQIGGYGWYGKYTKNKQSVDRNRWGVGLKYEDKWVVRSEYMWSKGNKFNADGAIVGPGRSDGWYALLGSPTMKGFKLYGKWDAYRDAKNWSSLCQKYCFTANYFLGKHLIFQANYSMTDDRAGADRYYNTFDVQVVAKF